MFEGLSGLGSLLKQAQEISGRMKGLNDELRVRRASGSSGGGMVEVEVNGLLEVLRVGVDPQLFAQADRELLEDLILTAVNQALAKGKLGQKAEAENELRNLLEAANQAVDQKDSSEGPRDRQSRNTRIALARYAAGLAHLGLGEKEKARQEFTQALQAAPDSLGPRAELDGGGQ